MNRRAYLGTISGLAVVGLSGCSSGPDTACADEQRQTDAPTYGPDDAPTVGIFVDYTCPGCQEYHAEHVPILKDAADDGTLQLVHRDFPLPHNGWSEPAAYLGRALIDTTDDGDFWSYLDDTLAEDSLNRDSLLKHAANAGVENKTGENELESTHYCETVADSKSQGSDLGVEGTPQLYFDNKIHDPISASSVIESVRR